MPCLQSPVGPLDKGTTACLLIKNQNKKHNQQASGKRKHPSNVEICDDDDDDDDDDDRLSVTAGHNFHVTLDGDDELSLLPRG